MTADQMFRWKGRCDGGEQRAFLSFVQPMNCTAGAAAQVHTQQLVNAFQPHDARPGTLPASDASSKMSIYTSVATRQLRRAQWLYRGGQHTRTRAIGSAVVCARPPRSGFHKASRANQPEFFSDSARHDSCSKSAQGQGVRHIVWHMAVCIDVDVDEKR